MLTLSIGAVLSDKPAHIPIELLPYLTSSWVALFYSIASGLLLMVLLVISTYHMGIKWADVLKDGSNGNGKIITTWPWLKRVSWFFGITSAASCLIGLILIAIVAIGVAGNNA